MKRRPLFEFCALLCERILRHADDANPRGVVRVVLQTTRLFHYRLKLLQNWLRVGKFCLGVVGRGCVDSLEGAVPLLLNTREVPLELGEPNSAIDSGKRQLLDSLKCKGDQAAQ